MKIDLKFGQSGPEARDNHITTRSTASQSKKFRLNEITFQVCDFNDTQAAYILLTLLHAAQQEKT